jgi:hypothetical protein
LSHLEIRILLIQKDLHGIKGINKRKEGGWIGEGKNINCR